MTLSACAACVAELVALAEVVDLGVVVLLELVGFEQAATLTARPAQTAPKARRELFMFLISPLMMYSEIRHSEGMFIRSDSSRMLFQACAVSAPNSGVLIRSGLLGRANPTVITSLIRPGLRDISTMRSDSMIDS